MTSYQVGDKVSVYNLQTANKATQRIDIIPDAKGEIIAIEGDTVIVSFPDHGAVEQFGPGLLNKQRIRPT